MTAVAYALCALIWGSTWRAIRLCLLGYPPLLGAALRFALAAAILLAAVALGAGRPLPRTRREQLALAVAGVLAGLGYALVYAAETRISGAVGCVIFSTMPFFTAALAWASGTERPRPLELGGATLALAGIAVVFLDGLDVPGRATGVALVLGSVAVTALYTVIVKREARRLGPLATTGCFLGWAAATLALLWAVVERPVGLPVRPTAVATAALLYLALAGSVASFACYFYLLRRVRVMTVTTLVFVQPIVALTIDVAAGDLTLGRRGAWGVALVLGGVAASLAALRREAAGGGAGGEAAAAPPAAAQRS